MKARYFGRLNPKYKAPWVFGDKASGMHLLKFAWFKIERHVLVCGNAAPDERALQSYWARRQRKRARDLKPRRARIAQSQQGCCTHCGEALFKGEDIQLHHKIPKEAGGTDSYANLELLHLFAISRFTPQRSSARCASDLLEPCA